MQDLERGATKYGKMHMAQQLTLGISSLVDQENGAVKT